MKHDGKELTYEEIWDSGWRAGLITGFFAVFCICMGFFAGYMLI